LPALSRKPSIVEGLKKIPVTSDSFINSDIRAILGCHGGNFRVLKQNLMTIDVSAYHHHKLYKKDIKEST
jgi:hypothetical protein